MINERVQYTAVSSEALIDTANPNLDGSGAFGTLMIGSFNGTLVRSLTIKAIGNTTLGMIRIFVRHNVFHGATALLTEIPVPYVTKSAIDPSFSVTLDLNYNLENSYTLDVSTENAESFHVTAEGLDWQY
ncbi:MAG: hypothetical protein JWO44_1792 [Bacteroidetes bacterium]|nr:hypothetical protein [Bacteroidota bacterium]